MKRERLENLAKRNYIHWLKFTVPKNRSFDHEICYNGRLTELLNTSFDRWQKLRVNKQ